MQSTITLLCCLVGEDPKNDCFEITVPDNATVAALKRIVQAAASPDLDSVSSHRLSLFKAFDINLNDLSSLFEKLALSRYDSPPLQKLEGYAKIAKYDFQDRDVALDRVHIVVQVPSRARSPAPSPAMLLRRAFLKAVPKQAPLSAGEPAKFRKQQVISEQPPDDCEEIVPTREDNALALELERVLSDFHENDSIRAEEFRNVMTLSGIKLSKTTIANTDFEIDGANCVGPHPFNLGVVRNEISGCKGDPYLQATHYYLESTRSHADKMTHSMLPCILIIVFGPYIAFAGAAWNGRPNVQVLSPALAFHIHRSDVTSRVMAARHLAAYRKACAALEDYYRSELPKVNPSTYPQNRSLFPYPTSFTAIDGTKQAITYLAPFTRNYSKVAHEFCASIDAAPRLRGFEKLPGGWFMVVMDLVDDRFHTYDEFRVPTQPDPALKTALHDRIWKCLREIHKNGFVHGDIRDVNLMVAKYGLEFRLLDFDWAGKVGVGRYPMNVFIGPELWRPADAYDHQLITVEHDEQMLERIIGPPSQ